MPKSREQMVEKEFNKFKTILSNRLGIKALYDDQLDKVGKILFGDRWGGVFAQDSRIPFKPNMYYIINTDLEKGEGLHWIGLYTSKTQAFLYDSYARNKKKVMPILTKNLKKKGFKVLSSDMKDKEQFDTVKDKELCGVLTLSWLCCIKSMGIRNSMMI